MGFLCSIKKEIVCQKHSPVLNTKLCQKPLSLVFLPNCWDDLVCQPPKKKPASAGAGKAVKGKKKGSVTAHDSAEPTEPEMSVRNLFIVIV